MKSEVLAERRKTKYKVDFLREAVFIDNSNVFDVYNKFIWI